jgi:hypothetical protein
VRLQVVESGLCLAGVDQAPLPFAIIAEAGRLEDETAGGLDFGRHLRGASRLLIWRHRDAEIANEALFDQAVLRHGECRGTGTQRLQAGEDLGGAGRDVLELVGDDVDLSGEGGERRLVVIGGDGLVRGDLEGRALRIGTVDVGPEAEAGGGQRQHAAELAAAEDADGRVERERGHRQASVPGRPPPSFPPLKGEGGAGAAGSATGGKTADGAGSPPP